MTSRRTPRRRELSSEERRLWERATRQTRRLEAPRPEPQPPLAPPPVKAAPAAHRTIADRDHSALSPDAARRTLMRHQNPPDTRRARPGHEPGAFSAPDLAPLSRRHARRIARERERIDARLDLHGMRQHEAHAALRRFLHQCEHAGYRLVLVITGKGKAREPEETEWLLHESPRGILRSLVPVWLQEPELRPLIASVSEAHHRDGGNGALYVRLKARRTR